MAKKRVVKWYKMTGQEILEETEYPSQWIGIVPVQGHELWVEGKRFLCGMVRRLMDGQRLHNYEMSALTEALMAQPKAPFLVSGRAIDGYENEWQKLNAGNPSHLPYNDIDESGNPVNAPIRLSPPNFPVAYANTANLAVLEMESAVGMPKPSMGVASNAVSGRAKLAYKEAGETATFHFSDNLRVAKEHVYRIIVDMLPTVYSGRRQAKILGEDDQQSSVMVDSEMGQAVEREGGKVTTINLGVGRYDVRVKVGPSFTTIREELGVKLQELGKGDPTLAAALVPMMMKMNDLPDADKIARVAIAMLPPEIQKVYNEDEQSDIPPAAKATIDQQGQQIQQMSQAMDHAGQVIKTLQAEVDEKQNVVQAEAKAAMAQIKAAQDNLKAQSDGIKAQERELADAKRIAMLELQLTQAKTANAAKSGDDSGGGSSGGSSSGGGGGGGSLKLSVGNNDEALMALAAVVQQAQEAMMTSQETVVQALAQNTQTVAQLQSITVDAIEDMADAVAAPREIKLKKGKDGKTVGATSVAVMPEGE